MQKKFLYLLQLEDFFIFRVEAEKLILNNLPLLPEIIFSPINIVLSLISKYENFYDFLYLLLEYFPTLSIQKMLFSLYMRF